MGGCCAGTKSDLEIAIDANILWSARVVEDGGCTGGTFETPIRPSLARQQANSNGYPSPELQENMSPNTEGLMAELGARLKVEAADKR